MWIGAERCVDLYGDSNVPETNGLANGIAHDTGPVKVSLSPYDVLAGVGKIMDMEFGIAATDQGVSESWDVWAQALLVSLICFRCGHTHNLSRSAEAASDRHSTS